jgi:hypothetical protein
MPMRLTLLLTLPAFLILLAALPVRSGAAA